MLRHRLLVLCGLVVVSCSGDTTAPPPPPAAIRFISSVPATPVQVATSVPGDLTVEVTSADGAPVRDVEVTFATSGGGTGAVVARSSVRTATDGRASTQWTLGQVAGNQALEARVGSLAPARLVVQATPAAPAAIEAFAGQVQNAIAGTATAVRPIARVADRFNNAIAGAVVRFTRARSSAQLTGDSVVTDASGQATLGSWTVGTSLGPDTVRATTPGVTNPAIFVASVGAAAAASLSFVTPLPAQAAAGSVNAVSPTVRVVDRFGNPVRGSSVSFRASAPSSVATATATTDSLGVASAGAWRHRRTLGRDTVVAAVGTLTSSGVVNVVAAPPASLAFVAPATPQGTAGRALRDRPVVRVADSLDNPVRDVTVQFAVPNAGNGAVSGPQQVTDSVGRAAVQEWRLGPTSGSDTLLATTAGVTAAARLVATAFPVAASVTVAAGAQQFRTVGQTVVTVPAVQVREITGDPARDVQVTFRVVAGGGSIADSVVRTDSAGVARLGSWRMGLTAGRNALSALAGDNSTEIAFEATATAAATSISGAGGFTRSPAELVSVGDTVTQRPGLILGSPAGTPRGAVVRVRLPDGGTVTPTVLQPDAAGIVRVSQWRVGTSSGQQRLEMSVDDQPPVTFLADVYDCSQPPMNISLGVSASAIATRVGCVRNVGVGSTGSPFGIPVSRFRAVLGATTFVRVVVGDTSGALAFFRRPRVVRENGQIVAGFPQLNATSFDIVLPAETLDIEVGVDRDSARVDLRTQVLQRVANPALTCGNNFAPKTVLTRGVSVSETITLGECPQTFVFGQGQFAVDPYALYLNARETVEIRMTSTGFEPFLRLTAGGEYSVFPSGEILATGVSTPGTSVLRFTNDQNSPRWVVVSAGASTTVGAGAYTLSVSP